MLATKYALRGSATFIPRSATFIRECIGARLISTSSIFSVKSKAGPCARVIPSIPNRKTQTVASMDSDWAEQFKRATVDLASMDIHGISYEESAKRMRTLLQTGLLKHADLHNNPERFFLAHRLLARHAPKLGPGFWIRFTVHYNLCVGTVLALGSPQQVEDLKGALMPFAFKVFHLTTRLYFQACKNGASSAASV
jgi:hypothetical protein